MSELLTERQWEQLSAYLDGELSLEEKSSLDSQLKSNQELAEALETLRQTRRLLQNLPKRAVPRNFTLTPEMVSPKSRPPFILFPAFSAVSAIAALLFFITLLFGRSGSSEMTVALEAAPAQKEALSAPAAETAAEPTPWIIFWGSGAYAYGKGGGGGYGGDAQAPPMTAPELALPPAPETTPLPEITANQQDEQAPLVGSGPILGVQSSTPAPVILATPAGERTFEPPGAAKNGQTGLLTALAAIALTSAGAAYIFWRRSRQ